MSNYGKHKWLEIFSRNENLTKLLEKCRCEPSTGKDKPEFGRLTKITTDKNVERRWMRIVKEKIFLCSVEDEDEIGKGTNEEQLYPHPRL